MKTDGNMYDSHPAWKLLLEVILLFAVIGIFFSGSVSAAEKQGPVSRWVSKGGYCYFYDKEGKMLTGLQTIGKRQYLFDRDGRQKIGWQKRKGNYYYFGRGCRWKGAMVRGKNVNHLHLMKNGKAALRSDADRKRMKLLMTAARIVEEKTRAGWSTAKKMRTVWKYYQSHYLYDGDPTIYLSGSWDVRYALQTFAQGRASCEGLGYAWAYLANACGAKDCVCVHDGGHGWSEIDGKVYDPSWDRVDTRYSYYGMSLSMSGYNNIPNYAKYGIFRKKV